MNRLTNVAKFLVGSALTYAAFAGCSAGGSRASGPAGVLDPVPEAAAESSVSGSRLKARTYRGEDGSRQFVGWRDTLLEIDCAFRAAGDGSVRCLPLRQGSPTDYLFATPALCNAAVPSTKRPALSLPCAPRAEDKYVVESSRAIEACEDVAPKVFKIGPRITTGYIAFACKAVATTDFLYQYEEVPLTEFVEASESVEP